MRDELEAILNMASRVPISIVGIALIGNLLSYLAISDKLYNKGIEDNARLSRKTAENVLKRMDRRSWLYNNLHFGRRLACENYLKETA